MSTADALSLAWLPDWAIALAAGFTLLIAIIACSAMEAHDKRRRRREWDTAHAEALQQLNTWRDQQHE